MHSNRFKSQNITIQEKKLFSSDTAGAGNSCHMSRQQNSCPFLMVLCRHELPDRGQERKKAMEMDTASAFRKAGTEKLYTNQDPPT